MGNAGYLIAAYVIVWAVVSGYIILLFKRGRRLRREIDSLRQMQQEKEARQ